MKAEKARCARCGNRECTGGKDCFGVAGKHREFYGEERIGALHRAATAIEGRHYCEEPRISEIILFAREMGYRKLGLAFCIGTIAEAKVVEEILSQHFEVVSVCCKVGGIEKEEFGLERIGRGRETESICNPAGQAEIMNRAGTELNVICGLCVGHDSVFTECSDAPVTTFITKDRVLAHNPAGAIYCQYIRRRFLEQKAGND
ncbi:MAG: DUF1847 domain-containing protein [Candidatus Latescibacteria bacterium]|nr:DUF1847 domain-containing protein [bacterium]MBD3424937.1 DUF1847 domain-containing protein [Candidatus Latescibacterota bacterium]